MGELGGSQCHACYMVEQQLYRYGFRRTCSTAVRETGQGDDSKVGMRTNLVNCRLITSSLWSDLEISFCSRPSQVSSRQTIISRQSIAHLNSHFPVSPVLSTTTRLRRSGNAGSRIAPGVEFRRSGKFEENISV